MKKEVEVARAKEEAEEDKTTRVEQGKRRSGSGESERGGRRG